MSYGKTRNPAMDMIRCTALFCVVSVHFFLNSGFYDETVSGGRMYLMTMLRTGFMVCVPLFMMLSGYLMLNRKPEWNYYRKIGKTLGIYLLASICCGVYHYIAADKTVSVFEAVMGVFSFSTASYSWYIEMYIGLFLLIPYLNILYHGLETQRKKQGLLVILLVLTALPPVLNTFRFGDAAWWSNTSLSYAFHPLLPDWWTGIYPFSYYFLGCYLREYPLRIRPMPNLLLLGAAWTAAGVYNCYRSYNWVFTWGAWQEWGSLFNVVQTVLLFSFLAGLDCRRLGRKLSGCFAWMSECCLGAYLVSEIFDTVFYEKLNAAVPVVQERFKWFVVIVPAVYLCSIGLSALLNLVWKLAERGFAAVFSHNRRLKER